MYKADHQLNKVTTAWFYIIKGLKYLSKKKGLKWINRTYTQRKRFQGRRSIHKWNQRKEIV